MTSKTKYDNGISQIRNKQYLSGIFTIVWNYLAWWMAGPVTYIILSANSQPKALLISIIVGAVALLFRGEVDWLLRAIYFVGVVSGVVLGILLNILGALIILVPAVLLVAVVLLVGGYEYSSLWPDIVSYPVAAASVIGFAVGAIRVVSQRGKISLSWQKFKEEFLPE